MCSSSQILCELVSNLLDRKDKAAVSCKTKLEIMGGQFKAELKRFNENDCDRPPHWVIPVECGSSNIGLGTTTRYILPVLPTDEFEIKELMVLSGYSIILAIIIDEKRCDNMIELEDIEFYSIHILPPTWTNPAAITSNSSAIGDTTASV